MAYYSKDLMDIALAKETTRGTAMTAPTKYLKVSRDSGFQYDLEHVENDRLQSQKLGEFPPEAGRKIATGKITGDLEAATIGELLYSCMGSYSGAQVGTTTAYNHTFSVTTGTTSPGYTFFIDRGVDYYRYTLGCVKRISIEGDAQGKTIFNADIIAVTEQTADSYSPTLAAPDPLMFNETAIELDDVAITRVGKWNFSIDNQAEALWTINQSQDAADIVIAKRPIIEGSMDVYFAGATDRTLFLANTAETQIEFILTGGALAGSNYKIASTIYDARYTAVPWDGELDGGLMGATIAFKGFYSSASSKAIDIVVTNASTTY